MAENRIWIISVRGKKDPHRVDASHAQEREGRLVLTDSTGETVGSFCLADVQGYPVEPSPVRTAAEAIIAARKARRAGAKIPRGHRSETVP
jgi:hypothetical protein